VKTNECIWVLKELETGERIGITKRFPGKKSELPDNSLPSIEALAVPNLQVKILMPGRKFVLC